MKNEYFKIEIEGSEAEDIYPDLISLEVEIDERLAGMARFKLPLNQQQGGTWSHLDDKRFSVWKKIDVKAGFKGSMVDLLSGYITHVRPIFAHEATRCYLEIWVMDKSVSLDREEKLKAWPNKKDSDIAREILDENGFTSKVEDTKIVHDEKISTIIQRETDLQFLKRLAMRNGFLFYVEGKSAYFRKPQLDGKSQPILLLHFEQKRKLTRFSVEVNGLTSANIGMFQVDRLGKEVQENAVEKSEQTALGKKTPETYTAAGLRPSRAYIGMNPVSGKPEMEALCGSVFDRSQWFVTAEGTIAANNYEHVLKTRKTVTIDGIGSTYSGVWYVTHVTHLFTHGGYVQDFKVKRNGLMLTGKEDFSSPQNT